MIAEPESELPGGSPASKASVRGPSAMTLAERFILAFHLPYALGCVLAGVFLFGILTTLLSTYADTSDTQASIGAALSPVNLSLDLLVAYAFYVPHYMRNRLAEAGTSLSTLLPDKAEGYRRIFSGLGSMKPQLITWPLFLGALLLASNTSALLGTGASTITIRGGPGGAFEFFAAIYDVASLAVATLGLSSVLWAYWSISRGIHRLGGIPLELRPYYEDAFLGLKPVGSLALSLATAYFVFIGLFGVGLAVSPSSPSPGDIIGLGGFLSGLILMGLALFFLPLRRLHNQMILRKQAEVGRLREKLAPVFQEPANPSSPKDIGHLFRLDMMDRKVTSMAVWPFDLRILGKLSVIALSVTAILISRIVAFILKI